jgi:exonuclease III
MKLLAWNIRSGGKSRTPRISAVIADSGADVLVLSEVRKSSQGLYDKLQLAGYGKPVTCIAYREFKGRQIECGAIAVLSRLPMEPVTAEAPASPVSEERWVEREIPAAGVDIVGLYGPLKGEDYNGFWKAAGNAIRARADKPFIVAGDLNTGERILDGPANLFCSDYYSDLVGNGPGNCLVDAWRQTHQSVTEYSWYTSSKTKPVGFRIDHVLVTRSLVRRIKDARYLQHAREDNISDHAPLLVEFGD